jgi:hypothetical protein
MLAANRYFHRERSALLKIGKQVAQRVKTSRCERLGGDSECHVSARYKIQMNGIIDACQAGLINCVQRRPPATFETCVPSPSHTETNHIKIFFYSQELILPLRVESSVHVPVQCLLTTLTWIATLEPLHFRCLPLSTHSLISDSLASRFALRL